MQSPMTIVQRKCIREITTKQIIEAMLIRQDFCLTIEF